MIDFGKMQQVIYAYIVAELKNRKVDTQYIKCLMHDTDTFWVSEFDDVLTTIENGHMDDLIFDELALVIEAVSQTVHEYYANAMNWPNGYKVKHIPVIEFHEISDDELQQLLDEIRSA